MKACDKALSEMNKLFRGDLAAKYQQLLPPTQKLISALMDVRIDIMSHNDNGTDQGTNG
jgi:hypothetical protein